MLIPRSPLPEPHLTPPAFEGPFSRVLHQVVLQGVNVFELHPACPTSHYLVVPVGFLIQKTFLDDEWLFRHFGYRGD